MVLCTIRKKKDIIKSLYFLTLYSPSQVPGIYFYKTNNIKITINNPTSSTWCIDGEKLEQNPNNKYSISLVNNIKILIPNKNIKKFT